MDSTQDFYSSKSMLDKEPKGISTFSSTRFLQEQGDTKKFAFARQLIIARRNVSPRYLEEPGPSDVQLKDIIALTAAAPDHGMLIPWRFILVPIEKRYILAEAFVLALIDRDPGATEQQIESARAKAHRAPLLLIAIARLGVCEPNIPNLERMVSMGAAIQNILLGAQAMGFGAGITSGQAMTSEHMLRIFQIDTDEVPICCINIGTISPSMPPKKPRPVKNLPLSTLGMVSAVLHN